jgi:hypothetical protein
MPKTTPYPAVDLGPLPVEAINAVLGTELEDGHAWLSETAHMHMHTARDHAADYPVCIRPRRQKARHKPSVQSPEPDAIPDRLGGQRPLNYPACAGCVG